MTSKRTVNIFFVINILTFLVSTNVLALTCSNPRTECIEGSGTRNINGVSVTLDCWKYRTTYECREASDNNCEVLRKQGCTQIGAKCRIYVAGSCVVQDETYKCSREQYDEIGDIACGKNIFCVGGNCTPTSPIQNNNFNKAAVSLYALSEASKAVRERQSDNPFEPYIFTGGSMECSRNIASGITKDCCGINSRGFMEGKILHCTPEEKNLAKQKENGVTIYVGEYCHNRFLKVCTSYHKVYCVFPNKIARIIQSDGRGKQLGIGFGDVGGDSAHPYCRGISPDELSRMDFNKMDFSPLYDEVRQKLAEKLPAHEKMISTTTGDSIEDLKEKSSKGVPKSEFQTEQKAANRFKEFYDWVKK